VLKAEIESGKWQPDERIPTETKIAERFGDGKIAVRQALQTLAEQGYIRRERGRGAFVARRNFDEGPRESTSFTEEMRRHDLTASSRVLEQSVAPADDSVADALRLSACEPVFVLRRLRLAGGEPVGVQTAHVPAARAREPYFASLADGQRMRRSA
jgi:GntR family transcriptional regulator